MNTVYLTSTGLRHRAFVRRLARHYPPKLVVLEPKRPPKNGIASPLLEAYQADLARAEQEFFGDVETWDIPFPIHQTAPGAINAPENVKAIRAAEPDWLLVFGASILSREILELPGRHALNIHTGLTQCFRGVDSAFWALHDALPEGIGATVHIVDPRIDTGDILLQGRPVLDAGDTVATIFMKTVALGFDLMEGSLSGLLDGSLAPRPLEQKGRLYQTKDFSEDALRQVLDTQKAVITDYLADKRARDAAVGL